tara:strand:+ start:1412 stop:2311 length:900 start_codon:yes stop_codon:yes gene_type:complete
MQIHTIDLKFQDTAGAIASFLVESREGRFLVEVGPESTRAELLDSLAKLDCQPSDLSGVLVTHIHLDHAGAAGWFGQQGIPVYVHRRGGRHLADPSRLIDSARQVYGDRFDSLWGGMLPVPADCLHELEDGDRVNLAGLEIEVIETPGHAFHHHAFAIGDVVFAGDAAGARAEGSSYLSVTSAPPQFDLSHTLSSIDKLAARDFTSLYLTHFGKVSEVATHLKDYRDAVELNATFVKQRLEERMDPESLQIAYQAFNLEQAFRVETPKPSWETLQLVNGTDMCADGIRLFWEKELGEGA